MRTIDENLKILQEINEEGSKIAVVTSGKIMLLKKLVDIVITVQIQLNEKLDQLIDNLPES